jgi:uncharacterized phage infection (PIP) family protein YhgE
MFRQLFKNRLFMLGLLIPFIFQLIYFCLAIPAIKDGNNHIKDMQITIVNMDAGLGKQISAQLKQLLPFKTNESSDLADSLTAMDNGEANMVLYIAPDFAAMVEQGEAQISYYINQSSPGMTKQAMEKTALSINQTLNENAFNTIKETIKQNSTKSLVQTGLPEAVLNQIKGALTQALDGIKYTSFGAAIQKTNNAEGFTQTVFPFFIFLTFFVGALLMTVLHSFVYQPLAATYSRVKILSTQLVINLLISLLIPCIAISVLAGFGIPLTLSTGIAWLLLAVGFFTLLYTVQMFFNWFGLPGMGIGMVFFFPLQIVGSGLIYSKEILPSFYSAISNYLPASYFGDGILKVFYGGASIARDIWILLLMSAIFIAVSYMTVFNKKTVPQPVEKPVGIQH